MTLLTHIASASNLKFLFICHASVAHGMGHLLRTANVAQTASLYTAVKILMMGEESLCSKYKYKMPYLTYCKDANEVLAAVAEWEPNCIFYDMLTIDDALFKTTSQGQLSISLSPIFSHIGQVDMVFHRSTVVPDAWSRSQKGRQVLAGLEYTIIDERVLPVSTAKYKQAVDTPMLPVAISMGGTDAANKTLKLLSAFKDLPIPMVFWVLLGEGYLHSYQDLVDSLKESRHDVLLIKSNKSMWQILGQCAVIFLGGGVTAYEAVYARLPSINLVENPDSAFLLKELHEAGALKYFVGPMDVLCQKALLELLRFDTHRSSLLEMHLRTKKVNIDRAGAERIVKHAICTVIERMNA